MTQHLHPLARYQVSTSITRGLVGYLLGQGVTEEAISQAAGTPTAVFLREDGRVSLQREHRLWEAAAQLSGDDYLGLTLGAVEDARRGNLAAYLCLQQPDLESMWAMFARYHRLVHDVAVLEATTEDGADVIEHGFPETLPQPPRIPSEFTLAVVWRASCLVTGQELDLREVHWSHSESERLAIYRTKFPTAVQIRFGQPRNRLVFAPGTLGLPVLGGDPSLGRILEQHAQQALAALPTSRTMETEVRELLPTLLATGDSGIDTIARRLGLSRRTLQRRLEADRADFRSIVDQVRRELALRYIQDRSLNVSEVGFLCGFSELAAFSRAFRRWCGMSPRVYRIQVD